MISDNCIIMMAKERGKMAEVRNLAINYKLQRNSKVQRIWCTGTQMTKELEGNMMDADIDSPFYGIYTVTTWLRACACSGKKMHTNPFLSRLMITW